MPGFRPIRHRIAIVAATTLLAGYMGVRTAADITTVFTFRGQQVDGYLVGSDSSGNFQIGEVTCIVGDDGNAKPSPIQKTWMDDEIQSADGSDDHFASTLGYNDFTGSYNPTNGSLNQPAVCDATASAEEEDFNFNTWTLTDYGAVTLHGTTSVGNPATVESGVSTTFVRDRSAGTVTRMRSHGKFGFNPTGTMDVKVIAGGSGTPPHEISGAITPDWSDVNIISNSRFQKLKP